MGNDKKIKTTIQWRKNIEINREVHLATKGRGTGDFFLNNNLKYG